MRLKLLEVDLKMFKVDSLFRFLQDTEKACKGLTCGKAHVNSLGRK